MEFSREVLHIIAFASVASGAIFCFIGYRIFKITLGTLGFVIGFSIAGCIAFRLSNGGETIALLAGLIGGVMGAAFMVTLYLVGIFCLGAVLGSSLGIMITAGTGSGSESVILLILAVIGGIAALMFQKLIVIISTSINGAWGIVFGIFYFVGGGFIPIRLFQHPESLHHMGRELYVLVICWVLLGLTGIIVQYRFTGKRYDGIKQVSEK